ncbi:hypothetical protein [Caldimonas brevitalea]|uniref:Uncharacterized protein n=1 Tax=Caldimonas brevitalea TaxID=413882 RepID=A0A0G3BH31_9BURK|nr:hypothetical protein [Caldimonas brevitalea]AKJ28759.1 hypothetical protein AAW51_2068 [Caldimonas brevitalea]
MASNNRIYLVSNDAGMARLVRATHPSHALRHVAQDSFTVTVASQDECIELTLKGIPVETIKAEQMDLPDAD